MWHQYEHGLTVGSTRAGAASDARAAGMAGVASFYDIQHHKLAKQELLPAP